MKNIAQKVPVETWETGPELGVVEQNGGAKAGKNGSKAKFPSSPASAPRYRPEQDVLGWEIRLGRLIRSKSTAS
ncbi:MAG: hypothetical protein ABSA47_04060 [Verrucomicrobiota bacterium]|jgi:hypothetical protein